MCEDRALRLRKSRGAKWARLLQARYRTRILQHLQATAPPQESIDDGIFILTEGVQDPLPLTPPPTPPQLPGSELSAEAERVPFQEIAEQNTTFPANTYCKEPPCCRARHDALFDIALRTAVLMKRNQQLQLKLAALQAETKVYIRNVIKRNDIDAIKLAEENSVEEDEIKNYAPVHLTKNMETE